jgi:hypothetical protein
VQDISVSVLTALGDIEQGRFADAHQFIAHNQGQLTAGQKTQWFDAITGLVTRMPEHGDQLAQLASGVLSC